MTEDDLTPRQVEFRDRLTALLSEYAAAVGPEFDGTEESQPMRMPALAAWVLVADWEDIADATNSSTVVLNAAAVTLTRRIGMLIRAADMARSE